MDDDLRFHDRAAHGPPQDYEIRASSMVKDCTLDHYNVLGADDPHGTCFSGFRSAITIQRSIPTVRVVFSNGCTVQAYCGCMFVGDAPPSILLPSRTSSVCQLGQEITPRQLRFPRGAINYSRIHTADSISRDCGNSMTAHFSGSCRQSCWIVRRKSGFLS